MNASYLCYAGIDVCKDFLDLHLLPSKHAERFPNTAAGHRALSDLLNSNQARLIVLEATGGYEHASVVAMVCAGLRVHVAQPQIVHAFAVSLKLRAKNDDIDAAVCARYAQDRCDELNVEVIDPAHEALRDLVGRRNDLVVDRTRCKNRLGQAVSQHRNKHVVRGLKRDVAYLTKEVLRTEKEIDAIIKSDNAMRARADTLRKIKGVGPQTVRIVLGLLPELGTTASKRLSSLVGVAPYASDSADKRKPRHIIGGRMLVRNVLYMACLTAAYKNPVIKPYYEQMRARGVAHKSAMMACIRRLLAHMNEQIGQLQTAATRVTGQEPLSPTLPGGARGLGPARPQ